MKSTLPFLFAVAAVGAIAWNGCGPGTSRYECDATGCYDCDGYGCTSVSPPKPAACTGTKTCASGQICTDKGCVTSCTADAQCAKGTVCKSGQCVNDVRRDA